MQLASAIVDFYLIHHGFVDMQINMSPSDKKSVYLVSDTQVTVKAYGSLP